MQKWECDVKQLTVRQPDLIVKLNALGEQGWEWVERVHIESTDPTVAALKDLFVLFRRPRPWSAG